MAKLNSEIFEDSGRLSPDERSARPGRSATIHRMVRRVRARRLRRHGNDVVSQLAIVIPVEGDAADWVTRLRGDVLVSLRSDDEPEAPPHITLKLGFPPVDTERLEVWLADLARQTPQFDLVLRDLGFFAPGIVFLDVESSDVLHRLRRRVRDELGERFGVRAEPIEDERFHPHVTLAHGVAEERFDELERAVASRELTCRLRAQHLDLFHFDGIEWSTIARQPLSPTGVGHP